MDFDFEIINEAVKTADMGAKSLGRAVGMFEKLKELCNTPQSTGNNEALAIIIDLSNEVANTKLANIDLKEQLVVIREQIVKTNKREREFQRYELWQSPAGAVVYRLKQSDNTNEPLHYLCSGCKENGIKSILQGHEHLKECPVCKTGYRFLNRDIRV